MSVSDNVIEFRPSADFTVADDGARCGLVFLAPPSSWVSATPSGSGLGGRVAYPGHPDLALTAYNLGLRGDTSAGALPGGRPRCPCVGRVAQNVDW